MRYLAKCIIATVTPWGRLPAVPYAVFALVLIAAHCFVQLHLTAAGDALLPYNSWSLSFFVMMWVTFCILSRRLHDAGINSIAVLPLLILTFASYIYVLDHLNLADSDFKEDRALLAFAEHLRICLQAVVLAALAFAGTKAGESGDTAFGADFSSSMSRKPRTETALRARDGTKRVAHKANNARVQAVSAPRARQDFDTSGPRGRITPAESARNRQSGFGQR